MISEHNAAPAGRRRAGSSRAGWGKAARRAILLSLGAAAAAALVAACGGSGGIYGTGGSSASSGTTGTAHHASASHGAVISTRTLPGVGTVLVDRSGKTLYSPQQEAHGMITCTGGCLSFWLPVTATAGATLHAPAGVTGGLGTIQRPGGLTQLTFHGKPLYTFVLDKAPGQDHGNDVTDHFGAASFTWHAITTTGTAQSGNAGGSSYQSGSSGY